MGCQKMFGQVVKLLAEWVECKERKTNADAWLCVNFTIFGMPVELRIVTIFGLCVQINVAKDLSMTIGELKEKISQSKIGSQPEKQIIYFKNQQTQNSQTLKGNFTLNSKFILI